MTAIHRIRLRGPWEVQALRREGGSAEPLPADTRMMMPARWRDGGWAGFAGRARHTRRFGKPANLAPAETVWLVLDGVEGTGCLRLNGVELASWPAQPGPVAVEVTRLLLPRNELVVEVEADSDAGGLWGEVALEVRAAALGDQPSR